MALRVCWFSFYLAGAQNDLERVTEMAENQIKHFGMNDVIGNLSFSNDDGGRRPYSKLMQRQMDDVRTSHLICHDPPVNRLLISFLFLAGNT